MHASQREQAEFQQSISLTLGPKAGIHPAMSHSHLARRIAGRTRRLSAGVWDMRIG